MDDVVDALSGGVVRTIDDEGREVSVENLIGAATLIELQPADVLVVEIDRVIDNVTAERIREVIGLHTGRRVLVIDGGRLRVLRETDRS